MQFIFKPNGLAVSNEDFLSDLQRVATMLGTPRLTIQQYTLHGQYFPSVSRRFGKWSQAIAKAGLRTGKDCNVTTQQLLADIQQVASKLKVTCLTQSAYLHHGKYGIVWIRHHFIGWRYATQAAGFTSPARHVTKTRQELLLNLEQISLKLGRLPTSSEIVPPLSICTVGPYQRCFGSWQKALIAFAESKSHLTVQTPAQPIVPRPRHRSANPRTINVRLRYRILHRDHFRCQACGKSPATEAGVKLQIDHIIPWSKGGLTIPKNLRTLCKICNIGKSNLTETLNL
jgi:hypothetical protein